MSADSDSRTKHETQSVPETGVPVDSDHGGAMRSIVQDWACKLGLRHQGVLMTAIRGCDGLEKNHVSKRIARAFRADVLNAHVGDPRKSKSFIQVFDEGVFTDMVEELTSELDVYPLHYIFHLAHAAEILGYKHPDLNTSARWRILYFRICKRLHVNPETEAQLDARLNADEATFASDGNNVNDLVQVSGIKTGEGSRR